MSGFKWWRGNDHIHDPIKKKQTRNVVIRDPTAEKKWIKYWPTKRLSRPKMINTSTRSQPTTKKYPSRFKAPPSLLLHPPPSRHCPLPDTDHSIQDYAFLCFQKNKKILHIVFNKYIYIYSYPFYFIYFCNF